MNFFIGALLGFIFSVLLTPLWIALSKKFSAYQALREEGPKSHLEQKRAIPTAGGIAIVISVLLATAAAWNPELWIPLGTFLACGALGLADDLLKIYKGKNLGLKARHKLLFQAIIGIGLGYALLHSMGNTTVKIPWGGTWDLGKWFVPFVALVLIATTNAVNLTDGLDGLAAGTAVLLGIFFLIVSALLKPFSSEALFSAALIGATLGFLWFNAHPAKVFMGDVGSLALGGALCALAFQTNLVLWLPIAGGVLVLETLSVILQVIYFKFTRGKRIFKMTPLHHHFELSGIPESQVTVRFWMISFWLCWLSLLGVIHGA